MASAGIDLNTCDPTRVGLVCSTNFGGATSWDAFVSAQAQGESATALLRRFRFDDAGDEIASRLGLQGPKTVISNSCSSGAHAIGHGADLIRLGRADAVLAGGHDALALSALAGLSALRTITAEKCRPFDLNRSGTIFGEGAGMVVLEEMTAARRRGAPILGELLGYAVNNNAYHMTAPDKDGAGLTMALRVALADAGVSPNRIDYISAHGTGTSYHDVAETRAIKAVLGDHAYRLPVSSIKPATGHLMAAAGAVEAITCLWAMRDGIVPPTLNYDTPDPDCDLDYVPNHAREASVRVAVSISSGIGGNNVALVLGKGDA
jgi:3-oxoacyl-(acyl-carrier-protein) synthase